MKLRLPRILSVRRTAATALLATAALALSSCSIYDIPLPGGTDTGDNPIKVQVKFRDVLDLVPQSTVKVDDVSVGKVTHIALDHYTAVVTLQLPRSIDLPDNTRAEIRQTSLLGEKFVSLSKPTDPQGRLSDGDVIGLENSGRNPEIEEVFSALALLLNGGGVGQLKSIAEELNTALDGREPEVRSIITQVRAFMGQLDRNKATVISALENLNRLSLQVRRQDGTIKQALDDIPNALVSVNAQRKDLVAMLRALSRLSGVGVAVIKASKESTIDSLKNLAPVLEQFAKAGQDLPKSLQVFLTYPFVDEAVGRDPEVARNLHMGDFTNLSIDLNLDLGNLPGLPGLPDGVQTLNALIQTCKDSPLKPACDLLDGVLGGLTGSVASGTANPLAPRGGTSKGGSGNQGGLPGGSTLPLPGQTGGSSNGPGGLLGGLLGNLGLGRTAPGFDSAEADPFLLGPRGVDPGLGTLLLQGVAVK